MSARSSSWRVANIFWSALLTVLAIVCFPANPLVLAGIVDARTYLVPFIVGSAVWLFGMVLVMAPIVMFPRRGGVPRGKSFVHTTKLVDTGIYRVVRHPQYAGGMYSIFLANMLFNIHWIFIVLGFVGIATIYMGCLEEDKRLIEKFGDEYNEYMRKVPRVNVFLGIARLAKYPRR